MGLGAALCLLASAPATAHAELYLAADATQRGKIAIIIVGSAYHQAVTLGEGLGEDAAPIAELPLTYWRDDEHRGPISSAGYELPWRCDRRDRSFWIGAQRADGNYESAFFNVRTPSCANRLALRAPARAKPGKRIALRIHDTWKAGRVDAFLCVRPPQARARCQAHTVGGRADQLTRRLRVNRPGRWRIELQGPDQRVLHTIAVGVPSRPDDPGAGAGPTVLVTGDSMMQSVDAVLGDELSRDANVVSDVMIGTGLTRPGEKWGSYAREHVERLQPAASIVLLGTNDGFPIPTPSGDVECCSAQWIAEYERRAAKVMRIYVQDGAGEVTWMTVPAARDERRSVVYNAVNTALEQAAASVPGVFLLRADEIFTPGGVYRDELEVRGRSVRVRETDGIHFSIPGARILAREIVARLRRVGLV